MIKETTVQELKKLRDEKANFLLLDVREEFEYNICNLGGKLIPLSTLPQSLDELDRDQQIIVHCRSGGRSRRAALFLQEQGFTHVSHLKGGISAWADEIDPSMARY